MKKCILCKKGIVKTILNLGKTPLANNLVPLRFKLRKQKKFSLIFGKCNKCNHFQLKNLVSPSKMFDNYLYISSASKTLKKHLSSISTVVNRYKKLKKRDLVIDIGSNDGTLLKGYNKLNVRSVGFEPAKNLSKFYKNSNINLVSNYFNIKTAQQVMKKYGHAKVITATNVFPHLQNLSDFAKSLKILMAKDGIFVLEAHYLKNLLNDCAFDTIYHEHTSYWSISAVKKFCEINDLELFKVEKLGIHHGQIRCWISRKKVMKIDKNLKKILKSENISNIASKKYLIKFKNKINDNKKKLLDLMNKIQRSGKELIGYGAPAKATTLLCFFGIKKNKLKFIIDKNPLKHNHLIPEVGIPIYSQSKIYKSNASYMINFAWNFIDEILNENKSFLKKGGKIINPIPKLKIHKM